MERLLEAEYIPFYFHDIRTNEIIAFHAFLTSLSDDYTANYESSEGFGRVEPVKIYKSTARKIGLSFYVAATSPDDFEEMWVKINKLVTLVYPQYSEGRTLTSEDGKYQFTQPFSQMIAASPMIRIRLGNLLSTNYSRFALARLFGATLGGAAAPKFGGDAIKLDAKKLGDAAKALVTSQTTADGNTWLVQSGVSYDVASDAGGIGPSVGIGPGKANIAEWKVGIEGDYIPVTIDKVDPTDPTMVIIKTKKPDADFFSGQGLSDTDRQTVLIKWVTDNYADDKNPLYNVIDKKFRVKAAWLRPTGATKKKLFKDAGVETSAIDDLTKFLDPEKNSLVKSFKSAGGRGLAGFIDSMNFDWYDKVRWDDRPGHKAPMMCKVTLSFTPIHDISPGLDSQGYNRAPIYPVGFFAHSTDTDNKK